ncbi:hypothetical protein SBA3_480020 [Candidatus Sulfopaludibacter sp. SbA3]|nr:hypothetical protein SBA3_480020 [Candidatus Sulfopaludibacter sp. SbA3]
MPSVGLARCIQQRPGPLNELGQLARLDPNFCARREWRHEQWLNQPCQYGSANDTRNLYRTHCEGTHFGRIVAAGGRKGNRRLLLLFHQPYERRRACC